jgi:hypothetical protein
MIATELNNLMQLALNVNCLLLKVYWGGEGLNSRDNFSLL